MPSVVQLREQLRNLGENVEGNKAILECRLSAVMGSQTVALKPRSTNASSSGPQTRSSPLRKAIVKKKIAPKSSKINSPKSSPAPKKKKEQKARKAKPKAPKSPVQECPPKKASCVKGPVSELNSGWRIVRQLGKPGKEGTVYEVEHDDIDVRCAMKEFKPKKALSTFKKQVHYQRLAAEAGAAPAVRGVITSKPVRLVMEAMSRTISETLQSQGGSLTPVQQKDIVDLCGRMDTAGIYHNDPNPLNLMEGPDGKFLFIDYGFSTDINPSKHGLKPNTRALGTLLHGGMQGLVTRKIWTGEHEMITAAVKGAAK